MYWELERPCISLIDGVETTRSATALLPAGGATPAFPKVLTYDLKIEADQFRSPFSRFSNRPTFFASI
jgi:hypothetical protein